jgi:hypothetical protein
MSRVIRICAVGCGLLGGLVASQGPEFSQQYRQRLGGGIDELKQVVARFEADARAQGETPESAVTRLRGNADELAGRQGAAMQGNIDRLGRLETHRRQMLDAGPFGRVAVMVRDGDADIMNAAYRDFEPAVPVTQEGLLSTAFGFVVVWGVVLLLAGFVRSLFRRRVASANRA